MPARGVRTTASALLRDEMRWSREFRERGGGDGQTKGHGDKGLFSSFSLSISLFYRCLSLSFSSGAFKMPR